MIKLRLCTAIFLSLSLLFPAAGLTQSFPSKQIRIVVPYPAGGPTDALARIVAQEITETKGWTIIVENKPGASGAIGTRDVAKADPDGHTIVLGNNQTHATNSFLMKEPGYDPVADFAPVAGLADLQHALVVRKDLGVSTVAELITLAKQEPGKLNYGSTGNGSGSHLAMELFKTISATDMRHIPFKGAAPMALEIVAGRIDVAFATLPSILGQVQGGEMKAIAIASGVRAPQLPDVKLLSEQGIVDAEADSWLALFAPAKTPPAIIATWSKAVIDALAKPSVAASAVKQGIAVNVREPEAFKVYLGGELKKWAAVIKQAQVKTD
jgi:tripartite-type tricarboxylate transporter receptor subunit TctC